MEKNIFDKISSYLLIFFAISISIIDLASLTEHVPWIKDKTDSLLLVSMSIFIFYMLSNNNNMSKMLRKIETTSNRNSEHIIKSLSGVEVKPFTNSDEAFNYLSKLISDAKQSIDQFAISPTPEIHSDILSNYLRTIKDVASTGTVLYRFISGKNYKERSERIREIAADSENRRFFAKFFPENESLSIPFLNFVIFDSMLLFVRYPNNPGQKEIYMVIKHPHIIELFEAYYNRIWEAA